MQVIHYGVSWSFVSCGLRVMRRADESACQGDQHLKRQAGTTEGRKRKLKLQFAHVHVHCAAQPYDDTVRRRTAAKSAKPAAGVVPQRPSPARLYDYLLGGRGSYRVDRVVGDRGIAAIPDLQLGARAQRAALARVVRPSPPSSPRYPAWPAPESPGNPESKPVPADHPDRPRRTAPPDRRVIIAA